VNELTIAKGIDYGVTALDGVPVVNSRKVAEIFGKRHDHVLRSITELTDPKDGVSESFNRLNFKPTHYKDSSGRKLPEYLLTKDGFSILVMGFTGKKALAFKEAYINRFNEMERFILNRNIAQLEYPELTDAIKMMHEEPKFFHYSNEADMINRIVLGVTARKFRQMHRLAKGESIRGCLTPWQAEAIQRLQKVDVGLVVAIPDFEQRKQALTEYFKRWCQMKQLAIAGGN
jgi:Rha family phage regulatory protein